MIVKHQKIKTIWKYNNKNHYERKGYIFTKYNDFLIVEAEDLPPSSEAKIKVICDYCKKEYEMMWFRYLVVKEKNQKNACQNCRQLKVSENNLSSRQDNLFSKAYDTCRKKGYILLSDKKDIKNNITYVKYLCPTHGENKSRINNLINGKGCPSCSIEEKRKLHQLSSDEVEKRISECHGVLLNKNEYVNRSTKNLIIKCPECSSPFTTSLVLFTQHGGQICDKCINNESMGEKRIRNYLENNNIEYKQEYWFNDCRDINPLPFDFYLPKFNTVCEFDGRQHFRNKLF